MPVAEQVTDPCAQHGEGPVWHDGWSGLRWVDMLVGDVLIMDSVSGVIDRRHVGSVAAALRPRSRGGAIVAIERGFAVADDDISDVRRLEEIWSDPNIRMNEGSCAPDGSFFCGSMSYDEIPHAGSLYRLDPEGNVTVVFSDVTVSNGMGWSPDGSTVYYVDTPTQRIDAFDYADGTFSGRRTVVHVDPKKGAPDGLAIDSEGGLWLALWGGGAVHHYTREGTLADVIELPVPRVTSCAFGGQALDELYITTSRIGTDLDAHPEAGALFRVSDVVPGMPTLPYLG
ncbi:gluconolactonase [Rhodococcus sp. WMMA185]|uniref:SMP-30/gluconolactonase/LRE family protein n=1 Tax=Rhodococcus sp. WMMA185 TaxID=679318 RepID=UPI000878B10F|nr:SMP-30/gluconolactonase/LRE family protein [Rhodococcus sp. WMMA185]AOW94140.1 gluconolactonase [Rhodococcus sp. WMMA185]